MDIQHVLFGSPDWELSLNVADVILESGGTQPLGQKDDLLITFFVERLYCKRPILCLASSKILTPHTRHRWRVCNPPPLVRREDTLAGWRGGGSIFWKTPDTALYSTYVSTLWLSWYSFNKWLYLHTWGHRIAWRHLESCPAAEPRSCSFFFKQAMKALIYFWKKC